MNRRVSVWKYVRIGKKWRYCKPAIGKNGEIKPDWVIVCGKEEHHPEGNFYLQRYEAITPSRFAMTSPPSPLVVDATSAELSDEDTPGSCNFSASAWLSKELPPSSGRTSSAHNKNSRQIFLAAEC